MANGELLNELRALAAGAANIDEATFRRLMLAAMADLYEKVEAWEEHGHPEIDDLKARDWKVIITAAVIAVLTLVAGLLKQP